MSKPFSASAAHQDLTEILNYIAADNPPPALEWVERIEAKCLLIAQTLPLVNCSHILERMSAPVSWVAMSSSTVKQMIELRSCG